LRAGEFGSSQGTAQICLPQLEPFDGRWFEIVFSESQPSPAIFRSVGYQRARLP
jgi:hypothetical protein